MIETATPGASHLGAQSPAPGVSGRERAYRYVRDEVLRRPESTGTFLSEQGIASLLGTSRTPVREALLRLQAEGLVEVMPKRGVYVAPMSRRQITEVLDLRRVLEGHAAAQAMARNFVPINALRQTVLEQNSVNVRASRTAALRFFELDRRFHQDLVDAAGSDLLSRTYAHLRIRQLRFGGATLCTNPHRQRRVCDEHLAIIDALDRNDDTQVQAMIANHLDSTQQPFLCAA